MVLLVQKQESICERREDFVGLQSIKPLSFLGLQSIKPLLFLGLQSIKPLSF
jgi:hypothetical protein